MHLTPQPQRADSGEGVRPLGTRWVIGFERFKPSWHGTVLLPAKCARHSGQMCAFALAAAVALGGLPDVGGAQQVCKKGERC